MKIVLLLAVIIIGLNLNAQDVTTEKAWIDLWQRGTISIGNIQYDTVLQSGKTKLIPYYNIIGTGVIFYIKVGNNALPVVVTAKHVVEQQNKEYPDSVRIRFSWHDDKSIYQYLGISVPLRFEGKQNWLSFEDPSIDLACFPLLSNNYDPKDSLKMLPYSLFPSKLGYYEGQDIYVLGYPGSVGKNYWTRGLVRRGVIAWLPKSEKSDQKFLIDCSVFPGNSGGPVFTKSRSGVMTYDTLSANLHYEKFLGIVIERRLNYNKVQTYNKGKPTPIKDANGLTAYASESIGVAVVEPAEKVFELLRITQEKANKKE